MDSDFDQECKRPMTSEKKTHNLWVLPHNNINNGIKAFTSVNVSKPLPHD